MAETFPGSLKNLLPGFLNSSCGFAAKKVEEVELAILA